MDHSGQLSHLIKGFQFSQALHVAATLQISDLLASGPQSLELLAERTATHGPTLLRLMRALEALGVYTRDGEGRWANSEMGELLRSDVPGSLAGWALYVGRPYYREVWGGLLDSVRTGDNAFARIHGMSPWEYRRTRPEEQAIFDRAMTAVAGPVLSGILDAYDFSRFETVCDVGGNVGTLLGGILKHYPAIRGIVFDQPDVVSGAEQVLKAAKVDDRCEAVAGDFFESVPSGADAYVLKSIIHDWRDPEALQILRNCRRAMRPGARLLVIEELIGQGPDPVQTAFQDLNMLVSPGGQERTLTQYGELFTAADLAFSSLTETGTPVFVIEAEPVDLRS